MRIAVCDDLSDELDKICSSAEMYGKERNVRFSIYSYTSAETFIAAVENGMEFTAALLDVCMPGMTGVEAAQRLRELGKKTGIIFLTTSRDYAVEAFSLSAVHYLTKPFTADRFNEAMDRIFVRDKSKNCMTVRLNDELITLNLDEVEFFEITGHDMHIYMSNGEQLCLRLTMGTVRGQIGENPSFADCGASYVVNLGHIKKMNSDVITMQCGERIPVPRRAYRQLEKRYLDYYRREVSGI